MTEEKKVLLDWVNSFINKKNAIEKRGIWTERDYYIDGNIYHIGDDWVSINGERAELSQIKPLKLFHEL